MDEITSLKRTISADREAHHEEVMNLKNLIATLREASDEDDQKITSLQGQVSAALARAELPSGSAGAGSSGGARSFAKR